jgi:aminoglycoside phosphotransferase (APT) family kinase protein
MTEASSLTPALQTVLRKGLDDPGLEVVDLHRLSGGASRETWSFASVDGSGRRHPRILQVQLPVPGGQGGPGMESEAALLRAAAAGGVPVPHLVLDGDAEAGLGRAFLVTDLVEGETIPRRLLRDDTYAAARAALAAQCGEALAQIHRIDPEVAPGLDRSDRLVRFRGVLDLLGDPHPTFELALRWLEANRPPAGTPTVVHGDFRLGNLLVDSTGLRAVLDWELAHIGDPLEDLGWLCVRSWRFGGPEPVGGFAPYRDLFAAYEQAGGRPVDPDAVRWWEVMGTLSWGVICIVQSRRHLDGHTRSVELATIGRRVAETEYDLLHLLGVSLPDEPVVDEAAPPAGATLHDRPTMPELIEAVRTYLEDEALGATEGSVHFHGQVAVNALKIVERELASGDGPRAAHAARLAALGCADDAALAAAIRSGSLDGRADVGPVLLAAAVAKLQVANPRWLH